MTSCTQPLPRRISVDRTSCFFVSSDRRENVIGIDNSLYEIIAIPSATEIDVRYLGAMGKPITEAAEEIV